MYLQVESVIGEASAGSRIPVPPVQRRRPPLGGVSSVDNIQQHRHRYHGGAELEDLDDGSSACHTPEEIGYYYTQYNSCSSAINSRHQQEQQPSHHYHHYLPHYVHDMSHQHVHQQNVDPRTLAASAGLDGGGQSGPGRPDRLEQVMSFHPQYLKIFNKSQSFIMRGDGPLPFHYRNYIAIMAAGRHQCSYLIEQQVAEFLQQGGDERWLQGLHAIPSKLRDLYEINKILAHRPWLITKQHIEKLTKGSDSWSLGELVHALVILSHYHAISSFVFGVGIGDGEDEPPCLADGLGSPQRSEEVDEDAENKGGCCPAAPVSNGNSATSSRRNTMGASDAECPNEVGLEGLMRRMKSLAERRQEFTAEEQTKRYQTVESQSAELGMTSTAAPGATRPKPEISQFIEDPDFVYQDFARRGEVNQIPTFRVQDYSWDDHAYSLVSRLYCDVGNLLDDKFRLMYQLTYNTLGGKKDVDTSRFRTAIWNYIQCLVGIRHDDYDYGEVNQVLERSLKAYIKMTVCFPERVTPADYHSVLKEFHHSEKIHVNLMLLEARIQAELLYALRAIMRYMT